MKRNLRNTKFQKTNTSKGITLVALVITIIVLLILAGVAINMAINSEGLFGKAKEATEKWNIAVAEEERITQNVLELYNEIMGGNTGGDEEDDNTTTLPEGWEPSKVASVVTEGTRKAPIPVGYVASQITADEEGNGAENTIAGGLVIYQGTDPVTGTAGSEAHNTAMTTRNQFVWIPVDDINQMVMCKSNNKLADSEENKICNIDLINGKLKCTNTAHAGTEEALCGRTYGTNFEDRTQTWTDNSLGREPDVLGGNYDTDDTTGNLETFTMQMTNDFINMAKSVAKYGGFYVSRYEAGVNGASKKNQDVITATKGNGTNYVGVDTWYGLYNAVKSSSSVTNTHMIYGSQYDQIINFIGAEAQKTHPGNVVTSQSKTGTKETDRLNNIYDLEGNNYEWTAQAFDTDSRVLRGGSYDEAREGFYDPANYALTDYPTYDGWDYATRISLYLWV